MGRFPGKGYRGREQSAPVGEGGLADGGWGGRSLSGDPRDGLCRPDSCFEGTHSSPKADAGVLPKGLPPGPGSTSVPLSPRLHCAGQGDPPSLRAAPAQSQAGGGEEPFRGAPALKPPALAVPSTGTRLSAGSTTSAAQKLGSCCWSPASWDQLPGTSRCQLGPGPLGQSTESRRASPPPARDPGAVLAPAPRPTRPPAPAPAPLRPDLTPPKGPDAGARRAGLNLGLRAGVVAAVTASSRVPGGKPSHRDARGDRVGVGHPGRCRRMESSDASGAVLHN